MYQKAKQFHHYQQYLRHLLNNVLMPHLNLYVTERKFKGTQRETLNRATKHSSITVTPPDRAGSTGSAKASGCFHQLLSAT